MENNQTKNTPFQMLGSLQFTSEEHLELFLQTLDSNSSLYCLVEAVKFCNSRGAFTLGEAELLAKCIRTISKEKQNIEDGTPDTTR
jgi:hypothetical protein